VLLYLVRHGEAKSKEEDPQRPLTARGTKQVRRVAGALARLQPAVGAIWHSGKRRAEQTAGLFAEALAVEPRGRIQPEARPHLEPEASPESTLRDLRNEQGNLLVVGHLPHLARLATALMFTREAPQALDLPAAAVICLERTADSWALRWLLTPELCP
jgi:phosphohistidine phosphatase